MEVAMASASTGMLSSVIGKLGALLGEEYQLSKKVKGGIRFLKDELSSMHAVLHRLAEMEEDQINLQIQEWRTKVHDLSYDIEDCIDSFILSHSRGDDDATKAKSLDKLVRKMIAWWGDRSIAKKIQELKDQVIEVSERRQRYDIEQCLAEPQSVPVDQQAHALYQEVRDLVGIDGPREEIVGWLNGEEKRLKVVSIYGIGGLGKTTLAMEVYKQIRESFDCGAFVSVSQTPSSTKILRDLLFHIDKSSFERSESWSKEQLILTLKDCLKCRRYLILIDDIWSTSAWEDVRVALPINNNQSRIITTTRNKSVATFCYTGTDGKMYEIKPLSDESSRTLFFKRMFSGSEECPEELRVVANDILRKCDGLPLAIISIAGLLVNRNLTVDVWLKILKSISSEVVEGSQIEKMKRILFLSYFDLPHYLKSCLLYLAVFPEDYIINCKHLIWMWVAEGLIPGQNRKSMEQQGQSYLNELINRSLVQPTKFGIDGKTVKFCRVHDVILDFLVSQAMEENFAAIWNDNICCGSSFCKIRRLSVQSNFSGGAEMEKSIEINTSHLRSLIMFRSDRHGELGKEVSQFLNSKAMRVLVIDGLCKPTDDCSVMDSHIARISVMDSHIARIGSSTHLKYLKIAGTGITKLPEQIGNLQHLETLDAGEVINIFELPASIVQLRKLVRLYVRQAHLPDGIGNLQALEELSQVDLSEASAEGIQGLGKLVKLRSLNISNCSLQSVLVPEKDDDVLQSNMVSRASALLSQRHVIDKDNLSTTTSQFSSMVNLTRLRIEFSCWEKIDINVFALLPMLLSLTVKLPIFCGKVPHPRHVIRREGFQRLMKFNLPTINEVVLMFEPGAMPTVQRLKLRLDAHRQFKYGTDRPISGLQNLSGLKHMDVVIGCFASEPKKTEALEDDIRGAAGAHPNLPSIMVRRHVYPEHIKPRGE